MTAASVATRIEPADLDDPPVLDLLRIHVGRARAETARDSAHALDVSGLRTPDIVLWAMWRGDALLGLGALKRLSRTHGEIKSMHVAEAARGQGAGAAILRHILEAARAEGLLRVSLETGAWDYFAPARALYRRHGFVDCLPFESYAADPNSVFLTLYAEGAT